jgi:histidinol-phosphatase
MTHSPYFQVALTAVQAAEKIILENFDTKIQPELKPDQSPVTMADKMAEQVIRQQILAVFPDHNILGEEGGESRTNSPYLWIIDPIDGTKNYLRKIPLFSTQLALMKNEELILGISNAPAINELMYAEKGTGAFLNHQPVVVSNLNQLNEAYLSYGGLGYFERKNQLKSLLKLESQTRGHRGYGEFWSYHLLLRVK